MANPKRRWFWVWVYDPQRGNILEYEAADDAAQAADKFVKDRKLNIKDQIHVIEDVDVTNYVLAVAPKETGS